LKRHTLIKQNTPKEVNGL